MRYVEGETLASEDRGGAHRSRERRSRARELRDDGARAATPSQRRSRRPRRPAARDRARATRSRGSCGVIEQAARALHAAHETASSTGTSSPANIMVTPERRARDPRLRPRATPSTASGPTLTHDRRPDGNARVHGARAAHARRDPSRSARGRLLARRHALRGADARAPVRFARRGTGSTRRSSRRSPPDPRRLNPRSPATSSAVVATAIEKDRDRRYQTALDFARGPPPRARTREPVLARRAGPAAAAREVGRAEPGGRGRSVAALLVVLVAGLLVTMDLLGRTNGALAAKERTLRTSRGFPT